MEQSCWSLWLFPCLVMIHLWKLVLSSASREDTANNVLMIKVIKSQIKLSKVLFKRSYGSNGTNNVTKLKVHRVTFLQAFKSGHGMWRGSGGCGVKKTPLSCEMRQSALTYTSCQESWIQRCKVGRRNVCRAGTWKPSSSDVTGLWAVKMLKQQLGLWENSRQTQVGFCCACKNLTDSWEGTKFRRWWLVPKDCAYLRSIEVTSIIRLFRCCN